MKKGNIALIGMMGTGKSHVGFLLAKKLSASLVDLDAKIEKAEKRKISDIFATFGENYFRDAETRELKRVLASVGQVISCGGGIVTRSENVAMLKENCFTVLLTADAETVYKRVSAVGDRPLLGSVPTVEKITEIYESRKVLYINSADFTVKTDEITPEQVAEIIYNEISAQKNG